MILLLFFLIRGKNLLIYIDIYIELFVLLVECFNFFKMVLLDYRVILKFGYIFDDRKIFLVGGFIILKINIFKRIF